MILGMAAGAGQCEYPYGAVEYSTVPIPPFDANLVLPPHLGNPAGDAGELSPYPCTTLELCERFGTSGDRRRILDGFLRFRAELIQASFDRGFHWLDGSFMEDIEAREARAPNDLDLVTFYVPPTPTFNQDVGRLHPILASRGDMKATYFVDNIWADVSYDPMMTVEQARYWTGLFSHRRDGIWKGMLRIELATPTEDSNAIRFLGNLP
jgi:hypothetical protein